MPLEDPKAQELVVNIRKRKGLKEVIPDVNDYMDKMWSSTTQNILFNFSNNTLIFITWTHHLLLPIPWQWSFPPGSYLRTGTSQGAWFSDVDSDCLRSWVKICLPVGFVASLHLTLVMTGYFRSWATYSSFLLIELTWIAFRELFSTFLNSSLSYLNASQFANQFVLLDWEFLELRS